MKIPLGCRAKDVRRNSTSPMLFFTCHILCSSLPTAGGTLALREQSDAGATALGSALIFGSPQRSFSDAKDSDFNLFVRDDLFSAGERATIVAQTYGE